MNTMLAIALVIATAAIFAALGYLFARHRAGSHDRHHSEEQNRLRTDLRLAEEQRDQARTRARELRTERDEAQRSQRERESAWSELTTRLNAVSEERGRLETEGKATGEALRKARSEAEGLQKSYGDGQRRIQELEGALVAAEKDKAALEAVIGEHKTRASDDRAELEKLRTERAELEKRQAEVAAAQKELEQVREEHSRIHAAQIKSTVSEMVSTSQEKLTATADKALAHRTKAVTDKLQELEVHLREFDSKRTSTEALLGKQIKDLEKVHHESRMQTASLVEALRKSHVRGQWGELQLKRAVELANLRERCDFNLQVTVKDDDGKSLRPDMVVNLTGDRRVVVDAKVSLDAFMAALEAEGPAERDRLMGEHLRQVRTHVDTLAAKKYHDKVDGSADFVLMFLPSEALLHAAMGQDAGLYEYALDKRVVIASPTVLVSMLRTIALSWNEKTVQENTEKVHKLGLEIYERLATMGDHLFNLGHHIGKTVDFYDKAIGSLERRVLKSAHRFTELGIRPTKELAELEPVERQPRELVAPKLLASAATDSGSVEEEPLG